MLGPLYHTLQNRIGQGNQAKKVLPEGVRVPDLTPVKAGVNVAKKASLPRCFPIRDGRR